MTEMPRVPTLHVFIFYGDMQSAIADNSGAHLKYKYESSEIYEMSEMEFSL